MVTRRRCWKDKWSTETERETAIDDCVGHCPARKHEPERPGTINSACVPDPDSPPKWNTTEADFDSAEEEQNPDDP